MIWYKKTTGLAGGFFYRLTITNLKLAGKILFVTKDDAEKLYLATRNLGNIAVIMADEINVYDIVNADVLVMDADAVAYIEEVLK